MSGRAAPRSRGSTEARGPRVLLRSEHPQGRAAARTLGVLARGFLGELDLSDAELSVVVTTDRRIRVLNREWRQKDRPTDVLSFPLGDSPRLPGEPRSLGDVVISLDTARRVAREEGRLLREELALYLAHGLLHLLGHDHHEARETRRMASAEERLLGSAGMVGRAALEEPMGLRRTSRRENRHRGVSRARKQAVRSGGREEGKSRGARLTK